MLNQSQKMLPKTFCPLPWTSLYLNTQGYYFNCCISENDTNDCFKTNSGEALRALTPADNLQAWNSPQMKETRLQMLQGEWPKQCSSCKVNEELGLKSYRQGELEYFADKIQNAIARTQKDGTIDFDPIFLDIKCGNLCNLACAMCSPSFSTRLFKDYKKLYPENNDFKNLKKLKTNWVENEDYWNGLYTQTPNVRRLHFSGGEPLINNHVLKFLDKYIQNNQAQEIQLSFNTNLTTLPENVLNIFSSFKHVILYTSIDGTGDIYEYIRHPGKFSNFDQNFQNLRKQASNLNIKYLGLHFVCQIYNLFNLPDFILHYRDHIETINHMPRIFFLEAPYHLNIQNLPSAGKKLAQEKIENFINKLPQYFSKENIINECKNDLNSLINYMYREEMEEEKFSKFLKFTTNLNNIRPKSIYELQPELKEIYGK